MERFKTGLSKKKEEPINVISILFSFYEKSLEIIHLKISLTLTMVDIRTSFTLFVR